MYLRARVHVRVRVCALESTCTYACGCLRWPEEGVESPGAGVNVVVVSHPQEMLLTAIALSLRPYLFI